MDYTYDGNVDFSAGVNSNLAPNQIGKSQIYRGVNVIIRNGAIRPRHSFVHESIKVLSTHPTLNYEAILRLGKFQAAIPYDVASGRYMLVIISGIIFAISLESMTAIVVNVKDSERLSQYHDRIFWSYAPGPESDLEIFDYPNLPVIMNGLNARRSNLRRQERDGVPLPETPPSRLGVFAHGRLFVANYFDEWAASDSTAVPNIPAPITFQESLVPGSPFVNQSFALPSQKIASQITAMTYVSSSNGLSRIRSTEYGPLLVASRDMISIFQTNLPRAQWAAEGFGVVELEGLGIAGQRAHINLNSDTLFIDQYGRVQSFARAVSQEGSIWTDFSLSRTLDDYTNVPDGTLHRFSVASANRNHAFFSVHPYRTRAKDLNNQTVFDYASRGLAVLELDSLKTLGNDPEPCWSGVWANVNPMEVCQVGEDTFVWSKDCDGINRLYRMDPSKMYDEIRGLRKKKVSRIYTRAFDHEQYYLQKEEHSVTLSVPQVMGDVNIEVDRKKDSCPNFDRWGSRSFSKCRNSGGLIPLGEPEVKTNGLGYHRNQLRITIEGGAWELDGLRLKSSLLNESDSSFVPLEDCIETKKKEVHDLEIDSICQMKI